MNTTVSAIFTASSASPCYYEDMRHQMTNSINARLGSSLPDDSDPSYAKKVLLTPAFPSFPSFDAPRLSIKPENVSVTPLTTVIRPVVCTPLPGAQEVYIPPNSLLPRLTVKKEPEPVVNEPKRIKVNLAAPSIKNPRLIFKDTPKHPEIVVSIKKMKKAWQGGPEYVRVVNKPRRPESSHDFVLALHGSKLHSPTKHHHVHVYDYIHDAVFIASMEDTGRPLPAYSKVLSVVLKSLMQSVSQTLSSPCDIDGISVSVRTLNSFLRYSHPLDRTIYTYSEFNMSIVMPLWVYDGYFTSVRKWCKHVINNRRKILKSSNCGYINIKHLKVIG